MKANIRLLNTGEYEIIFSLNGKCVGLQYRSSKLLAEALAFTMNADIIFN